MFRRLLAAMFALALPVQGLASATMMHCGSHHAHSVVASAEWAGVVHQHGGDSVDEGSTEIDHVADHRHDHSASDYSSVDPGKHQGGNSESRHAEGSDCCATTVALATSELTTLPAAGPPIALAYDAGILPSVFLEGLRRPPRTAIA